MQENMAWKVPQMLSEEDDFLCLEELRCCKG